MGYKQASGVSWFRQKDVSAACYEDGDEKKAVNIMMVDPEPVYFSEESGSELSDREESESEQHMDDAEAFNEPFEPESPEAETPEADAVEADAPEA